MNVAKWLGLMAVAGVLASAAPAQKDGDLAKKLLGKWEVTKADEGTLAVGSVIEFTKDGKFKAFNKAGDTDTIFDGTYKVTGDKFDLDLKIGNESHKLTITITKLSDDELLTKNDEGKVVETKRKK
jgi:uncharacterized protein (TIGR03066 family)